MKKTKPCHTARESGGILYTLERSDRKTLCLMVTNEGAVRARAPRHMPVEVIDAFVIGKAAWVRGKLAAAVAPRRGDSREHELAMRQKARAMLPNLLTMYSGILGVVPLRVTITGAEKRFGSCSSKGALCFSWRLFQYPDAAIEYVVVHELAHLIHLNHSIDFHAAVQRVLPDWKQRKQLLKHLPD